ncbi:ferredoxin-type protein NapF [Helicobacter suis]|uniref:Ferredoxin-type protein NapF n=1 Tax=Helicobacter suis TaxID=104628 RepID=A0ABM7L1H0_9HELI|nr:4Fe-4S dicluster domain-containing protein [Helicobacter suis]BCD46556.1 ferredoxin-type protein NapF [Helicobacter suis]
MRRKSFKDLLNPSKSPIPLPYFNPEKADACLECSGECVPSCPEKIIFKAEENKPYLRVEQRGCIFCKKCVLACESTGFKVLEEARGDLIQAIAQIDLSTCLSYQKVICFSCKDICMVDAIHFTGLFYPSIQTSCTGCGMCMGVCPTQAIQLIAQGG